MDEGPFTDERSAGWRHRAIPDWLVLPGMLALVLLGLLAGRWLRLPAEPVPSASAEAGVGDWRPTPQPPGATFALTIDFGNGAERRFATLPWRKGQTVLEALQAAANFRPGITFTYTGKGDAALLTSIDGLKNAGATGGNWIYEINGDMARRSIALETLRPGDALLWRYAPPP